MGRRGAWVLWLAVSLAAWAWFLWGPPLGRAMEAVKHCACFAPWTWACLALGRAHGWTSPGALIGAAGAGLLAAAGGEVVQIWTPSHSPEWRGFGWSCAGVALGVAMGWVADHMRLRFCTHCVQNHV